ncbi:MULTISPECIES: aminoglycoside phosphotransferase family protein [unclassified Streptomyces]|uniref:aminoglycoside phosphotransferase family protein n=1 Tax=unclassified Streptomyces TaxID=2593676 RepID=UPI0037F891D9
MNGFDIDDDLVRTLIREQHPDFADLDLRPVDGGWDNQMWRLGDELAVRMPRTERAPTLLRTEHRWMPELAPRLPLPVPVPVRVGEPSERFPRLWTVTTWVPGEPADRTPVTRGRPAADALAGFLGRLHREAPADAPVKPERGGPLEGRRSDVDAMFASVDGVGDEVREVWEDALAAPVWQGPPMWIHSDLHPANVVVADGTLAGVVDFGDLGAGDPATDLAAAWVLLPEGAAPRFLHAYAHADEAMIRRARGWAVLRGLMLLSVGRAGDLGLPGGKVTWGPAGRATLDRVVVR